MRLIPALVASTLAVHTAALLIPLEIAQSARVQTPGLTDLLSGFAAPRHIVDLDCPGCPYFAAEEPQSEIENQIHLEFDASLDTGLTVNGVPIFPSDPTLATLPNFIYASQLRTSDNAPTRPLRLDFAWERLPPVISPDSPDTSVLPIRFTILGLEGHSVQVDTIAIDLIQSPAQTTIARISNIPFVDTPGATTCDPASKWSLCRLRAIIAARLQTIMEAAKQRAAAAHNWVTPGAVKTGGCRGKNRKFGGRYRPGPHGHHGHKGHHHRLHRIGHLLHQTLRFFVIPALLGIVGGLIASAVGMLVGQLVSYLWIKYHRGGRRGYHSTRVVEIVIAEDEKDALTLSEEELAPPAYTDEEVAVDEKH